MIIRTAELEEDPRPVKGTDGQERWRAVCIDPVTGYRYDAHISLRAGEWYPFRKGDRVTVVLPWGSSQGAEIVGHKGQARTEPANASNTEIHARQDADGNRGSLRLLSDGGRVDLGEGDPTDQALIAMHADVATELKAIKAALDALARHVDGLTAPPSGGALIPSPTNLGSGALPGVPIVTGALAITDALNGTQVKGGRPATNVYAKPQDD